MSEQKKPTTASAAAVHGVGGELGANELAERTHVK